MKVKAAALAADGTRKVTTEDELIWVDYDAELVKTTASCRSSDLSRLHGGLVRKLQDF